MQINSTLANVCMAAALASLIACQQTPMAPAPSAAPTKPLLEPATTGNPETEPSTKTAHEPIERAEDWILPGTIGSLTTRLELETRFGTTNVRVETFDGPEGSRGYPVLVVFPDVPRKRLELVQDADNPDAPILELRISHPASRWHDANGLRPGLSLSELVTLNGAPISFYGVGWDYGGVVQDWHGGKLANAVDAEVFHRVVLAGRKGTSNAHLPLGDASFRSDDARFPTMGTALAVAEVEFSWPHEGED